MTPGLAVSIKYTMQVPCVFYESESFLCLKKEEGKGGCET